MRAVHPAETAGTTEALDRIAARLLLVDGHEMHLSLLESRLSTVGFAVQTVGLDAAALDAVHAWTPEAMILDVMHPSDGFVWIPMFRRLTHAPIIMLSPQESASDKVAALMRGADDYVTRPFDMDELIARVHSALRRPVLVVAETLRFADLTVDPRRRIVVRSNRSIELSKREFDLLLMLLRNLERVLTRNDLLDGVWGADANVTSAMVDTYICYLRAKIDAGCDRKLIHTVRGVGYTMRDTDE